ncbi:MAG: GTPase Era, partial [Saprospiraceae bacterium]|nr:GTPase Era [Saprospiraceae bacterium]
EDADVMLMVVDKDDRYTRDHVLIQKLSKLTCPIFLVLNKIDLMAEIEILRSIDHWKDLFDFQEIVPISALKNRGVRELFNLIVKELPEGPRYFPEDQLSDRPERFFVSEIVREQIFLQYRDEIPYSCEVAIESFKEEPSIVRIEAMIFVNRKTQKAILIGKHGEAIKRLGTEARIKMESFLGKKVFLALRVKVRENWRNNDGLLDRLGYSS